MFSFRPSVRACVRETQWCCFTGNEMHKVSNIRDETGAVVRAARAAQDSTERVLCVSGRTSQEFTGESSEHVTTTSASQQGTTDNHRRSFRGGGA